MIFPAITNQFNSGFITYLQIYDRPTTNKETTLNYPDNIPHINTPFSFINVRSHITVSMFGNDDFMVGLVFHPPQ